MSFFIGLDIGGTKIAGAAFDDNQKEVAQIVLPTPSDYSDLVTTCADIVRQIESKQGKILSVGVGVPGPVDQKAGIVLEASNTPCLSEKPLCADLQKILKQPVAMGNDANLAALSEAVDGAGEGYRTVFGLIMGTGVGGGIIVDGKIVDGPNGLAGEFGHVPLPFREEGDGPFTECSCRQKGCVEKSISGGGLSRLYMSMTGVEADASTIAAQARDGDSNALRVLDRFYTVVAKGMVPIIHALDPEIIVVSGGLNALPGLYDKVPKRWSNYTLTKNIKTKFAPAKHGAMSGLRGAAWLGKLAKAH